MNEEKDTLNEERDIVVFSDDEGNEFELDVIDYFEHEGTEYAVLMDLSAAEGDEEESDGDAEQDVYIMKVVVTDDVEEFLPADDEKMDILSAIVEERLNRMDEEEDGSCGCSCGCCDDDEA